MGLDGYKIRDQQAVHFITFATVQWIDVFTRSDYVNILIDSFANCQKEKGLLIYAYYIIPNHLHLIISAVNNNLYDIIRDFKKFTAVAKLPEVAFYKPRNRYRVEVLLKRCSKV